MERRLGSLRAEHTRGEGGKFTAPMVLVHGLWETAVAWRPFVGFLSHRGWDCFALHLRDAESVAMLRADLHDAIAALDTAPVLIGHDLGALLALDVAAQARAVVALAPLVLPPVIGAPPEALARAGNWITRWRGRALAPPRGRWRTDYDARAAPVPTALVRELSAQPWPVTPPRARVPVLVLAGAQDAVTDPAAAQTLAAAVAAPCEISDGGHALAVAAGWEARVSRIHRWAVRELGEELLALYAEAMEPD